MSEVITLGISIAMLAVEAMLEVGSRLVAEHDGHGKIHDRNDLANSSTRREAEPSQTKFGFHTPPFLTVRHLLPP